MTNRIKFNYKSGISLVDKPLVEAWFTLQWNLNKSTSNPTLVKDLGYDLAVENLAENISTRFKEIVALDTDKIPEELTPYRPRIQFRTDSESGWPVLQIGPGVATVNYTTEYNWDDFKDTTLYLRSNLVSSYSKPLEARMFSLRYRNAVAFEPNSNDVLAFLKENLNVMFQLPKHIPGDASNTGLVQDLNLGLAFPLEKLHATGQLNIVTGFKNVQTEEGLIQEKNLVFDVEVKSEGENVPSIDNKKVFENWLDDAHRVAHEWFFSLIEGSLRTKYEKGEE